VRANECIDYAFKAAYPANVEARLLYVLISKDSSQNVKKLMERYDSINNSISTLKSLNDDVKRLFSDSCIGHGKVTRESYYLDDINALASYVRDDEGDGFIKDYMYPTSTLPEAIELILKDANLKLASIEVKIKSSYK
jgi:hypothetical protein